MTAAPIATATDGKSSMEVHQGLVLSTLAPVIKEDDKKVNTEDEKVPEKIERYLCIFAPSNFVITGDVSFFLGYLATAAAVANPTKNLEARVRREYYIATAA